MERRFRLTQESDFKRVRHEGKSYAHPLLVLISASGGHGSLRVGITAGKAVGGAVARNRCKRFLREALREFLPHVESGWDIMLIARAPLAKATLSQTRDALSQTLIRAKLMKELYG